jgi:predicted alpha/beta superfamily hydrolase
VYPFFEENNGTYEVLDGFQSRILGNTRSIVVYTPPSYSENPYKRNYPLLVMHDGQNIFNDSTSSFGVSWRAQQTLDSLIGSGQMIEILVVGIYNTPNRTNELTYSYDDSEKAGGDGDNYLDFVEEQIIPFVQRKYRSSQGDVTLLGSSLGGLISCYAGWTRSTYTRCGCMSSSFWWNNEDFNNTVMEKRRAQDTTLFYIDSGDSGNNNDGLVETLVVRDHYLAVGFKLDSNLYFYTDHGGQHNEQSWGDRFWIPMKYFFAPQNFLL